MSSPTCDLERQAIATGRSPLLAFGARLVDRRLLVFLLGLALQVGLMAAIVWWEIRMEAETTILPGVLAVIVAAAAAVLAGPLVGAAIGAIGTTALYVIAGMLGVPHSAPAGVAAGLLVGGAAWIVGHVVADVREERRLHEAELLRLFNAERRIAHGIQKDLLIEPNVPAEVLIGHLYHSATREALVGGDFYDVFPLGEHVGLIIGDVAGHGVQSAVQAAFIRESLAAEMTKNEDPERALLVVHESIIRHSGNRSIATAYAAIVDRASGAIRYGVAGHPPALVRDSEGKVHRLAFGSPPLGAQVPGGFVSAAGYLRPGDLLLLYTDGVTESRRGGDFFGEARLAEILRRSTCRDVTDLPQRIFDELNDFTQGVFIDDLAIVTFCYKQARAASMAG